MQIRLVGWLLPVCIIQSSGSNTLFEKSDQILEDIGDVGLPSLPYLPTCRKSKCQSLIFGRAPLPLRLVRTLQTIETVPLAIHSPYDEMDQLCFLICIARCFLVSNDGNSFYPLSHDALARSMPCKDLRPYSLRRFGTASEHSFFHAVPNLLREPAGSSSGYLWKLYEQWASPLASCFLQKKAADFHGLSSMSACWAKSRRSLHRRIDQFGAAETNGCPKPQ